MSSSFDSPFYTALWRGFYDKTLYCEAARFWRGKGFAYMALLSFIAIIPVAVLLWRNTKPFFEHEWAYLIDQVPVIELNGGVVHTKVEQPYFIHDRSGNRLIGIDTTGKITDPHDAKLIALLTKTQLIVVKSTDQTQIYELSEARDNMTLTRENLVHFSDALKRYALPVTILFYMVALFIWQGIKTVIYALFGIILCRGLKVGMEYGALMQLSIIALGAPLLVMSALLLVGIDLPASVTFAAGLGYLYFGIQSVRESVANT